APGVTGRVVPPPVLGRAGSDFSHFPSAKTPRRANLWADPPPAPGALPMAQPHDPNLTADIPPSHDSLGAGLAAGFGPAAPPPRAAEQSVLASFRHTYGVLRPVLLRDADPADSAHVVRPHSDAMPPAREAGTRYQLFGEIARGGMGAVLRGRDADLGR